MFRNRQKVLHKIFLQDSITIWKKTYKTNPLWSYSKIFYTTFKQIVTWFVTTKFWFEYANGACCRMFFKKDHMFFYKWSHVFLQMITCFSQMITCFSQIITCFSKRIACFSQMITCFSQVITCFSKRITCFLQMICS